MQPTPRFEVDHYWPQALPVAMCCTPAPPVLEFDIDGRIVNAWGGESADYDWPQQMHGIYVDHNDYVWIGANQGSHDMENVGGPANMVVHGIVISHYNRLYMSDRPNNRIQIFELDGTYVDEVSVRPETTATGSTWEVTLYHDPEQR